MGKSKDFFWDVLSGVVLGVAAWQLGKAVGKAYGQRQPYTKIDLRVKGRR